MLARNITSAAPLGYYRSYCKNFIFRHFSDQIIRNRAIPFPVLRVVNIDNGGESSWKIMERKEAFLLAKSMKLDLVLINPKTDPPVCKLESRTKTESDVRKRIKIAKPKPLKEMIVGALIEDHDLETKMSKVIKFLEDGHQVKVTVSVKGWVHQKNPTALDEVVLKVLDRIEDHVSSIQKLAGFDLQKAFVLIPKKAS
jgi:translation initiation factor IF-3